MPVAVFRHVSRFAFGWLTLLLAAVCTAQDLETAPVAKTDPIPAATGHELVLQKWSGTLNVPDPVACAVDPQGRVYVSATTRRKVADLDIREHAMWISNDVALTSAAEKSAFLHEALAPGKLRAPRGMLKDHNGDGSIDWKDLTVHTERIYQLRDTDGNGTADKITVFAEGFNTEITGIAAGVMYHDGWVYATIAPDLWRLKDTNDDGVADIREIVVHGFGHHLAYAGHDMHGLSVGPDGRIYWSIGDKGVNVTSKEGRHFFAPNEGAVMRVDPDGTNFEIYARGLRNVQEPAFDAFGDLIGVDNDADQPGERERFVFIAEGSDSGWRCNYQYMGLASPWMREGLWKPHFSGQAAYLLPPISNYSDGPAGFRFDPGTALGDGQRGMFLLNEFPSGKMRGFRIERNGATFKMKDARIVTEGVMGIGMSWNPDGSLLMVDWIGGYALDGLGAVWRVDAREGATNPLRLETYKLLTAGFAQTPDATLVAQLGHVDQRVRQGAQMELAKRGRAEALLAVALGSTSGLQSNTGVSPVSENAKHAQDARATLLARVHAIWGFGQLLRRNAADPAAIRSLLQDPNDEIRRQVVKIFGDASGAAAKAEGAGLVALLGDSSPRVLLQVGIALGKFHVPAAAETLFALAAHEGQQPVIRHAIVSGLVASATPQQLAAKKSDPSLNIRLASVVALRRLASPLIAEFLADTDLVVIEEAARGIHDDLSIPAALPALAAALDASLRSESATRRAINAGLRLGTADAAARLLAFALNESAPRAMREEALVSLRVWQQPPPLDRVDGWARKFQPAPIASVLSPKLNELLALADPGLKTLAIETMMAHQLKPGAEQIALIVGDAKAPAELRAQSLRLIAGDSRIHPAFLRALESGLAADAPGPLYRSALDLLLPQDAARLVAEAKFTLAQRDAPEKQQVLLLLGRAGTPEADTLLDELGASLLAGTAAPELQLDIAEALRVRGTANTALATKLKTYSAAPAAASRHELLAGGDVLRGKNLVATHLNANCVACHAFDGSGGSEVGPNLRTIGSQHDAAYLLESLLNPSAKIAIGFGIVTVTARDKSQVTGTLARETPEAVEVRLFDGTRKTIARADVAAQTPPISIMPPMADILQPRELRDVVAYLTSLRPRRTEPPSEH
jgi:quinoprotein glucose dehydrogenase